MRVLVVDDEEGILRILRVMLGILGHEAITAGNGRQAIDYLSSNSGAIDTLLTDLKMPEMNGYVTIREARLIRPDLAVILMSGSLDAAAPKEAVLLPKPFTLASVSMCLDLAVMKSRQESTRALKLRGKRIA